MSTLTSYNGLQIVSPAPTGPGGLAINNNFKALSTYVPSTNTNPSTGSDSSQGFSVGSRWYNSYTTVEWICLSSAVGAAVWTAIASANYLPLAGGSLTGALLMGGNAIKMNTGGGTGGGSLDLDGGAINLGYSGAAISSDSSGNATLNATSFKFTGGIVQVGAGTLFDTTAHDFAARGSTGVSIFEATTNGGLVNVKMSAKNSGGTLQGGSMVFYPFGPGAFQLNPANAIVLNVGGQNALCAGSDQSLQSVLNILDDGSGNCSLAANLVVNSSATPIAQNSPLNVQGLPSSSAGLHLGDVWNDGGVLKIA